MEFKNCIFCSNNHDNIFVKTETQQGNVCQECFETLNIQEEKCILNYSGQVYTCKSVIKFIYKGEKSGYTCYPCTVLARIPSDQLKAIACQSCGQRTSDILKDVFDLGIMQCSKCVVRN